LACHVSDVLDTIVVNGDAFSDVAESSGVRLAEKPSTIGALRLQTDPETGGRPTQGIFQPSRGHGQPPKGRYLDIFPNLDEPIFGTSFVPHPLPKHKFPNPGTDPGAYQLVHDELRLDP
jgi:hypothetical protein